ncbi:MAG: minor capsid protein [Dehalococcoidales bacterium]|nr:minor capsid protein [Dehalococcoidales bacterium]
MSGAMVDAESAVADYLETTEVNHRITNSGTDITVIRGEFNSDSPRTCISVRDAGGMSGEKYMRISSPWVRVWIRSDSVDKAKTIIARIDDELHQLGPKALNDTVFCLSMIRNTDKQRLDDPETKLVQYFITYATNCRRIE